jgi:hypothetical protein
MFVPVLFKVSIRAVKCACPLLLVEVDLISLVNKVCGEKEYSEELCDLRQESRVAVGSRHKININQFILNHQA